MPTEEENEGERIALFPPPSDDGNESVILPPVPLIYDDTVFTASIQKVLFVNSAAVPLETHANATTFPIVYDSSSSLEDILEVMRRKFPSTDTTTLSRIGFAFHNHGDLTSFVDRESWFTDSDLEDGQTIFSRNAQFMLEFLREFKVTHVDFLACKTLQSEKWRKYFGLIQTQTGVIVGASDDDTGNVKYGGDWVLESTMEDVRDVYFTAAIESYASLLVSTMTIVANVGHYNYAVVIVGDILYTSQNNKLVKIDLLTNTIVTNPWYTGPNHIAGMCSHGEFIYFTIGIGVGRINVSTGVANYPWVTGVQYPKGIATDGTYLYVANCNGYQSFISRTLLSYTGAVPATPFFPPTGMRQTSKINILGNFLYASSEYGYVSKHNLSDGSLVQSNFISFPTGSGSSDSVFGYGNFIYASTSLDARAVPPQGIWQAGLDGVLTSQTPWFFNQQNSTVTSSGYTTIFDMVAYNNRLYCATNDYGYVFYVPLPVTIVTPVISTRPTAATAITYPATLGTVSLSGGSALTAVGGTAVPGTFIISSSLSSSVYNAGTYIDVSATFNPTDTAAYLSVSTSIPSITVLKATPFLASRPTSATVIYPNKLGAIVVTGGSCTVTNGGAALPGTFIVHPDLSNSVFAAGTYQDVSAIFIPTASINYNQIATTIQTLTITQPSTAQLASIGVSVTDLKTAGYSATELKTAGFTATQQKSAGFSAAQMKNAGFDVSSLYQIFTTPTEKKSVTKAVVSDLLTSTSKTTVPLSTLVGYTFDPLVTSVVAVKVTDVNTPIVVSRSELQSGAAAVYAVIDVSSSYIVIPTWYSSIRVMNIGNDKYRIYDSKGTTILYDNLLVGDTRTHDGLTVVIGSVTATFTPPPTINFVLTGLNSFFTLSSASEIPNYQPTSLITDATITLTNGVSASDLQNTFFFRTDNPITTDASFVYYYVDTTKWSNQSTTLNPKNGIVTTGGYVANDNGSKDFIRDLARQLFGTYLAADLFTNEDAVVTDINLKFDTVATNIVSLLTNIDKTSGSLTGLATDEFGKKYLKDVTTTSNISRELFNQLITSAPARFVDIKTNSLYNSVEDGFYKMPIMSGDKITFKVTISPSSDQMVAVPTGRTSMTSRSYTVILNVT